MNNADKPWADWSAAAYLAARKPKGWWRRNLWGLLAVVPLLAVVVALRYDDFYWAYWRTQPHVPMPAAQHEWIGYTGAQLRLVEFGPAGDLAGFDGDPLRLPGGLTPWRAVIEFKAPDQESVAGCKIALEDSHGRIYGMRPDELSDAKGLGFDTCSASSDTTSTDYRSTVYFVTPGDAVPVAVRISRATELPRFARLRIGG